VAPVLPALRSPEGEGGAPLMKLDSTITDIRVILLYRSIDLFKNLKFQAPRQKNGGQANSKEIPNFQYSMNQTGLGF
jgi:hypothetical protein